MGTPVLSGGVLRAIHMGEPVPQGPLVLQIVHLGHNQPGLGDPWSWAISDGQSVAIPWWTDPVIARAGGDLRLYTVIKVFAFETVTSNGGQLSFDRYEVVNQFGQKIGSPVELPLPIRRDVSLTPNVLFAIYRCGQHPRGPLFLQIVADGDDGREPPWAWSVSDGVHFARPWWSPKIAARAFDLRVHDILRVDEFEHTTANGMQLNFSSFVAVGNAGKLLGSPVRLETRDGDPNQEDLVRHAEVLKKSGKVDVEAGGSLNIGVDDFLCYDGRGSLLDAL